MDVFVRVNFLLIFCFVLTFVLAFSGETEEGSHSVDDLDKLIDEEIKEKGKLSIEKNKGTIHTIIFGAI